MKKKKSFIKTILTYLFIVMILLIVILGLFLGYSYQILYREISASSDAFLSIYENELDNNITKMDGTFKGIASQVEDSVNHVHILGK